MTSFLTSIRPAFVCSLLLAGLTGCAVQNTDAIEGQTIDRQKITHSVAPLFEAKDRQQWSCTSKEPLSTKHPLNDIVFVCEDSGVEATLAEMKDAGWRMIALDIGKDSQEADGTISMPLRITVIKLF